jgi:hypothetical protein
MKKLINFKKTIWFTLIVTGVASLQSCIVYRPYPENAKLLSVPDIIQMSKDGVSSMDIIAEINQSHTVYSLKADQLVKLRDEGVQDSVLNYMEETKINAVQQNQRYADSSYWMMAADGFYYGTFGLGLGWGWPYGYMGWGWGPSIIYSVNRGFSGGFHGGGGFHNGGGFHGGGMRR